MIIYFLIIKDQFVTSLVLFLFRIFFYSRVISPALNYIATKYHRRGCKGLAVHELVRRLQSSEPSGKSRATRLMSLVKHGHDVLLADREDDPYVVGGVDNAIILYRAIEKDRGAMGEGKEERKDIFFGRRTARER